MLQDPGQTPTGAVSGEGAWPWLRALWDQPELLEIAAYFVFVAGITVWLWRTRGWAAAAQRRQELADQFVGIELQRHGDAKAAERRLRRVVEREPDNHLARHSLAAALADLGEGAEAERHFLLLRDAFGATVTSLGRAAVAGDVANQLPAPPAETVALQAPLADPAAMLAAIRAEPPFVRSLCRAASEGAPGAAAAARADLLDLREAAVSTLLEEAGAAVGPAREALLEVLAAMGPSIAAELVVAVEATTSRAAAMAAATTASRWSAPDFTRTAALLHASRRSHAQFLVDCAALRGSCEELEQALAALPAAARPTCLQRVEEAPLRTCLAALRPTHPVLQATLADAAFRGETALVAALAHPDAAEAALAAIARRRPTRELGALLIDALAHEASSLTAARALVGFGPSCVSALVQAVGEPGRRPEHRHRAANVLLQLGAVAAGPLCAAIAEQPRAGDPAIVSVLAGLGDVAIDALLASYRQAVPLERVAGRLLARANHRRAKVVETLAMIATPAAAAALRSLAAKEPDKALLRALLAAAHGIDGRGEGAP